MSNFKESYTGPNGNVCDSQDDFNDAFKNAVDYVNKKNTPAVWVQLVFMGIMIILIVWALVLASKVGSGGDQKLHFILALVFSPFYIISYFLDALKN